VSSSLLERAIAKNCACCGKVLLTNPTKTRIASWRINHSGNNWSSPTVRNRQDQFAHTFQRLASVEPSHLQVIFDGSTPCGVAEQDKTNGEAARVCRSGVPRAACEVDDLDGGGQEGGQPRGHSPVREQAFHGPSGRVLPKGCSSRSSERQSCGSSTRSSPSPISASPTRKAPSVLRARIDVPGSPRRQSEPFVGAG